MELTELIAALADRAAYPTRVGDIDVRQTHISVVFLAGEYVYKIKKPVRLGFLDFSTLELRRHYCAEEVRLNARLAADVYLDVVPIARVGSELQFEAAGEPVEWAVKMRRLSDDATLESHLRRGEVRAEHMASLAEKLAAFHASAERSRHIAEFGRDKVVEANALGNFEQSRAQIGETISPSVFARLERATTAALQQLHPLIDARAERGVPCDTHGDLRVDHVYFLEDRPAHAERTVIIDCIEFNEAYRYSDPVADMAFLTMDLKFAGQRPLADAFAGAYFQAAGDDEGRQLLPFYTAYRAAVRGKVEGLKQAEREVAAADRAEARARARGYWLLALGELEPADRRPCLVLVGGLPGSGKSTLAAALGERAGFTVIRSDVVRKELAGKELSGLKSSGGAQPFGSGLYTAEWNERTYAECLRRAEASLFEGERVIVDASFREETRRQEFIAAAARWRVPSLLLLCQADRDVIQQRLAQRAGDASDADWSIYQAAAEAWETAGPDTRRHTSIVDSGGSAQQALASALSALQAAQLAR